MCTIGNIIELHRNIEHLLINDFGASGKSFRDKVYSIRDRLPESIVRRIFEVAKTRNKVAHIVGFEENIQIHLLEKECNEIVSELNQIISKSDRFDWEWNEELTDEELLGAATLAIINRSLKINETTE